MKIYRYATLYREPGPGAIPREGLLECGYTRGTAPSGHHAWGWVDYNRQLTDKEIHDYELEYVHSAEVVDDERH